MTPFFFFEGEGNIFIGAYIWSKVDENMDCVERLKKLAEKVYKAAERILPIECPDIVDGYDAADCFAIVFYRLLRKELELNGFKFCTFTLIGGVDADVDVPFIECDYSVYVIMEDGSVRRIYP